MTFSGGGAPIPSGPPSCERRLRGSRRSPWRGRRAASSGRTSRSARRRRPAARHRGGTARFEGGLLKGVAVALLDQRLRVARNQLGDELPAVAASCKLLIGVL